MRLARRVLWGTLGISVVLSAMFGMSILSGKDSVRAGAADTQILEGHSSSSPTYTPSVVLVKGGVYGGPSPCSTGETNPTTDCLYLWAKNVNNTTGASAFEVKVNYDSSRIRVWTIAYSTLWLASTNRSVGCIPPTVVEDTSTGAGEATISCNTIGGVPPYGPACNNGHCNGLLGLIAFQSRGDGVGTTALNFTQSVLVDTPPNPDNQQAIPATVRSVNIVVAPCADFNGDGTVLVSDILYVVGKYGGHDALADLNGNGSVRVDDILIAVGEYHIDCTP